MGCCASPLPGSVGAAVDSGQLGAIGSASAGPRAGMSGAENSASALASGAAGGATVAEDGRTLRVQAAVLNASAPINTDRAMFAQRIAASSGFLGTIEIRIRSKPQPSRYCFAAPPNVRPRPVVRITSL